MPQIEELPDDFDENLDLNKVPIDSISRSSQSSEPAATTVPDLLHTTYSPFPVPPRKDDDPLPEMPPAMASVRNASTSEILEEMNKIPLFMTSLDSQEDNEAVEALKAMAYEGSPREVATNFKEQGNDAFREKRFKDAVEFYGKGLFVISDARRKRIAKEEVEGDTDIIEGDIFDSGTGKKGIEGIEGLEKGLEEALAANRAAVNLELKNYRRTLTDTSTALKLNPQNLKALYRSTLALLGLSSPSSPHPDQNISLAVDVLNRGLSLSGTPKYKNTPEARSWELLEKRVEARRLELEVRKNEKEARQRREEHEAWALKTAMRARGIRTRSTGQPPEMEDAAIRLTPDPVSPTSTLTFPVVLLYPLTLQSDFIKAFSETESLSTHFKYILPPPWNTSTGAGKYATAGKVHAYAETATGGLIRVGKKVSLLTVLSGGKIEVIDGLVKISIVPISDEESWIADMKAKKQAAA